MKIARPLTWNLILELEPRLNTIVHRIVAIKDRHQELHGTRRLSSDLAHDLWYGFRGSRGIKSQLNTLVGWEGGTLHEELQGSEAYDVCYRYLFDRLCRQREG